VILFRVDASPEIGLGHLMRCLALAQGFHEINLPTVFVVRESSLNCTELLLHQGITVTSIPKDTSIKKEIEFLKAAISKYSPLAVVLDGYDFGYEYQQQLKSDKLKLVFIGSNNDHHYAADIIVNQNIWATKEALYNNISGDVKLLLGNKYLLLRNEILKAEPVVINNRLSNILVTFGGSRYSMHSFTIYDCLKDLPFLFNLVAGDNAGGLMEKNPLTGLNDHQFNHNLSVFKNIYDLSSLMQQADLVICAAGSTCWELCYLGVPFITYILADNQEQNAACLQNLGISLNMGWWQDFDCNRCRQTIISLADNPQQRKDMHKAARKIVDGKGVERVVREIVYTTAKGV